MSEVQVVCPKCNGTDSYMGFPTSYIKGQMKQRVHLCRKCDIRMHYARGSRGEKLVIIKIIVVILGVALPILYVLALWSGTI